MIREITIEPTGPLSFTPIVDQMRATQTAISPVTHALEKSERLEDEKAKRSTGYSYRENPSRSTRFRLYDLDRALGDAIRVFSDTKTLAESAFLLLNGTAGMGKTHLLCDLATKRLKAGLPTVLLMGQRFLQPGDFWTQALQQLDLPRLSAEEFIGALEAASQASKARTLLIIDALNEGAGRNIWPNHLGAFLQLATRSPWVSVVASVRSSYESLVLPAALSDTALRVSHLGFAEHEYDASKTFFQHYGIELPSTPLLAPEYRSPLFLKTMCVGLKNQGCTRLPRGFHGISQVFRLYTNAINTKLSESLDFDPRSQLVLKALQTVVSTFPSHQTQWLPREKAISLVNALLPNRSFHDSLYQGLVGEGLLVEDFVSFQRTEDQEFVHLGYERLADHLTAEVLLDDFRQHQMSEGAVKVELAKHDERFSSGVLESLFIQVSESLKQELMDISPSFLDQWGWAEAYRQSLVWRAPTAFTDRTLHWFNQSILHESDDLDALEVVLTLSSVPDHPWNARFLDRQLQRRPMPERDAWWTIKLHSLYSERRSAVHRIIDWALSVKATDSLDQSAVSLVSSTLAWMFASSNRFLRDRATKANVNLLTGRESLAVQLVRGFGDVDDLYIRERVLAVAYGVAMRSNDTEQVRELADSVLETVFAKSPVAPHLLLRDYARGVMERLHSLAPLPDDTMRRVRPPYGSKWPRIPSEKTIERIKESFKGESKDLYGARRIVFSVMDDDFARYVIGTNSWLTDWLSIRLGQPVWHSYKSRITEFAASLDSALQPLWASYADAEDSLAHISMLSKFGKFRTPSDADVPSLGNIDASLAAANQEVRRAKSRLLVQLGSARPKHLRQIWRTRKSSSGEYPPKFNLRLMQRYILKRVFDLGWTADRFNCFDTQAVSYEGRKAAKAERIGKKYQWIAYHEVCALVADNFQYRTDWGHSDSEELYEGPWQDFFRDIDPSHPLLRTGGDSESKIGWWAPAYEPDWDSDADGKAWAETIDEFPNPVAFLTAKDSEERPWLVVDTSLDC